MATVTPLGPRIRKREILAVLEEAWAERERELEEREREERSGLRIFPPRLRVVRP